MASFLPCLFCNPGSLKCGLLSSFLDSASCNFACSPSSPSWPVSPPFFMLSSLAFSLISTLYALCIYSAIFPFLHQIFSCSRSKFSTSAASALSNRYTCSLSCLQRGRCDAAPLHASCIPHCATPLHIVSAPSPSHSMILHACICCVHMCCVFACCFRYRVASLVEVNAHSLFSKWFSESGKQVAKECSYHMAKSVLHV